MKFEEKIPYIDKIANIVFGFILAYILAGYFSDGTVIICMIFVAGLKEIWWDRSYDVENVDIWDFVCFMVGAGVACLF